MLVAYGVVAAYVFGFLMTMFFWPFSVGPDTSVSFVPGDPLLDNLHRFLVFTVLNSSLGWDTGRAITNALAIVVIGPAVLATLRRASRRASFGARPSFSGALPSSPTRQSSLDSDGVSAHIDVSARARTHLGM